MLAYINQLKEPLLVQSYVILFFVSFLLCFVIILSSGYGFNRRSDLDAVAVQSAHKGFIPRVGGLAIYISICGFIPLFSFGFIPLSVLFDLSTKELTWLVLSAFQYF